MSRISVIEELYSSKRKSALEFDYDKLYAPPILTILTPQDVNELTRIATSLKYNANITLKYKLIDAVMSRRGFKRAHCGTNRVVYNYLEDPRFVAKVAVDKVGMTDTPAEFKNQEYLKPFCCKIFEVSPNGVIGFVERVNPVSSLEEFISIADDVFNMMITKIIGKYVVDDLGTTKFLNIGVRSNAQGCTFGPVVLDFPYVYELDGNKLICNKTISTPHGNVVCGGEIDYDDGLNYLMCTKCGKTYKARELAQNTKDVLIINDKGGTGLVMRGRIVDSNNKIVVDSGLSSKTYVHKDQCKPFVSSQRDPGVHKVAKRKKIKNRKSKMELVMSAYTTLQLEKMHPESLDNTVIKKDNVKKVRTVVKANGEIKKLINDKNENVNYDKTPEVCEPELTEIHLDLTSDDNRNIKDAKTDDTVVDEIGDDIESTSTEYDDESDVESDVYGDVEENVKDNNGDINIKDAISTIMNSLYTDYNEPDYSNYEPEAEADEDEYDNDDEVDFDDYVKTKKYNNKPKRPKDTQLEDY